MANNSYKFQLNTNLPELGLFNVNGDTPEEFRENLTEGFKIIAEKSKTIQTTINDLKMSPTGLQGSMDRSVCKHENTKVVSSGENKKGKWELEVCNDCKMIRFWSNGGAQEWKKSDR